MQKLEPRTIYFKWNVWSDALQYGFLPRPSQSLIMVATFHSHIKLSMAFKNPLSRICWKERNFYSFFVNWRREGILRVHKKIYSRRDVVLCGFLFPHLKRECQKYVNFSWGMQMCECLNVSEVLGKRIRTWIFNRVGEKNPIFCCCCCFWSDWIYP